MEHQNTQAKPTSRWRARLWTASIVAVPLVLAAACSNVETNSLAFDDGDSGAAISRSVGEAATDAANEATVVDEAADGGELGEEAARAIGSPVITTTTTTTTVEPEDTTTTTPATSTTTTIDEVSEATTTTTAALEARTTTEAPETTTTAAAPAEGLATVVNTSSGETYSVYTSTADQYPASEEQFWAVAMVDFSTPGGFGAEQRECLIREFLISPDGQQLVADDIAGNQSAWSNGGGAPVLVDEAVLGWFNTQQACAL